MIIRINILLFFSLFFAACISKPKIKKTETSFISFKSLENNIENEGIINYLAPYKKIIDAEMNELLAISINPHIKELPESNLGNLVCDLSLKKANSILSINNKEKANFVLLNNGGLRASLPKGEITRGKIFELLPFENELVVLTLSGKKTKELFDYVSRNKGMPMAGIYLGISDTITMSLKINNETFDINKNYRVLTNDYLAAGGDKMKFFKQPISYEIIGIKLRDAIIEEIKEIGKSNKNLDWKKDGRIFFEK